MAGKVTDQPWKRNGKGMLENGLELLRKASANLLRLLVDGRMDVVRSGYFVMAMEELWTLGSK
jgi:hypothetical protein